MNTLSAISTFGNTDFKLSEIIFTGQGDSQNFHQEPSSNLNAHIPFKGHHN
jgi:hypothetical protein